MATGYVSKVGRCGRVFVLRLKPNADLVTSLKEFVEREGVRAGVILSGAGLLKRACLRNVKAFPKEFPVTDANRAYLGFERPLEVLAITGNVSDVEGKPSVHAHAALSFIEGDRICAIGGHVVEGCVVYGFAEIVLMELEDIRMEKKFDGETKALQLFVE